MSSSSVRDLTLALDLTPRKDKYTASLFDGWPEEDHRLAKPEAQEPFEEVVRRLDQEGSDDGWGRILFDWAFPPQTEMREVFLRRSEEVGLQGERLRLWICISPSLARYDYFQWFERFARVSLEGFWVSEWSNEAKRPPRVRSPFVGLNPWIAVLRHSPGASINKPFSASGKLNVLVIASNPPPDAPRPYQHIEYLDQMLENVCAAFREAPNVGWVGPLRNPSKAETARSVREHKPHVLIYLGHGYADMHGAGLALAAPDGNTKMDFVSGVKKGTAEETELERLLAGKVEVSRNGRDQEQSLPEGDRLRLVILLCCEAAMAAPPLLEGGIPAVLAMRQTIGDKPDTAAMVQSLIFPLIGERKPVDQSLTDLRHALIGRQPHWSVPVLHLGMKDTILFPDNEQYARGEYIHKMRERCGRFDRRFQGSTMNDLTDATYMRQPLAEMVKEKVQTPQGLEEREREQLREFRQALRLHRKVVSIGRAGRGKSALLYRAVLDYLSVLENDETAAVPIYVRLKDLRSVANLTDFRKYLKDEFSDETVSKWLWDHFERGNVLLLLDALDEVPREVSKEERSQWAYKGRLDFLNASGIVNKFVLALKAPQSRIVLTCRDSVYREREVSELLLEMKGPNDKEGFLKMELKPFRRDDIVTYASRFFQDDGQTTRAFLKDIEVRKVSFKDRYTHLAEEPLFLHMMCWLWAGYRRDEPG